MMAFISQTTRKAPLDQEVSISQPVLGATISQIANALNHLAFAKGRKSAIAYTSRDNPTSWIYNQSHAVTNITELRHIPKGNQTYIHLHQSSKNCEYIGFVFKYASSDQPISITVSLVRNPTTTQDIIDNGCVLSDTNGELVILADFKSAIVSSSSDTTGTSSVQTNFARPLYLPSTYRGNLLALKIDCVDCRLDMIGSYELYKEQI
jgi:hypothetical protein